jgi:hypothetical protein
MHPAVDHIEAQRREVPGGDIQVVNANDDMFKL